MKFQPGFLQKPLDKRADLFYAKTQYFKCDDRERLRGPAHSESRRKVRGGARPHEIAPEQGAESESK